MSTDLFEQPTTSNSTPEANAPATPVAGFDFEADAQKVENLPAGAFLGQITEISGALSKRGYPQLIVKEAPLIKESQDIGLAATLNANTLYRSQYSYFSLPVSGEERTSTESKIGALQEFVDAYQIPRSVFGQCINPEDVKNSDFTQALINAKPALFQIVLEPSYRDKSILSPVTKNRKKYTPLVPEPNVPESNVSNKK